MTAQGKNLDQYRDTITAIFRQNMLTVCADPKWTAEERAGTALMCATTAIGAAAAAWRSISPHLANAPDQAVLREVFDMLAEVLCKPKPPHLHVVANEGDA